MSLPERRYLLWAIAFGLLTALLMTLFLRSLARRPAPPAPAPAPAAAATAVPIPVGMRLITIPVDEYLTFGYRLRPGSKVDVVRVQREVGGTWQADLVLPGVVVYAVGEDGQAGKIGAPRSATLLVTPPQALQVARLLALDKGIRLLLRGEKE